MDQNAELSIAPVQVEESLGFIVSHQKLELEVDFISQSLIGRTEITIIPQHKSLQYVRFNARQCDVVQGRVMVNGQMTTFEHANSYERLDIPPQVEWTVFQHEMQKEKVLPLLSTRPSLGELRVAIPKTVQIEEKDLFAESAANALRDRALNAAAVRVSTASLINGATSTSTPTTAKNGEDAVLRYAPLVVSISFTTKHIRDGLQFVGMETGDQRYPHVYTRHSRDPGIASCLFPCVDDPAMRCTWEITIKCGRTLGDVIRRSMSSRRSHQHQGHARQNLNNGHPSVHTDETPGLSTDDSLLEMAIVCSGDQTNEIIDANDSNKKTVSFICSMQVAASHIGFAIGPFESVDLSDLRTSSDDDKLGQKAVQVVAYCLPSRSTEVRNVCEALPSAIDWMSLTFGSYPFSDYKMCFIDDQISDTECIASLAFCSTRLLFRDDVIDLEVEVTRKLVQAIASQWIGVSIIPATRADTWIVVGMSYFIADLFMREICGNNEYRYRQKALADKLVDLDIQRPSIYALGETLHLGSFEMDFMVLKAPLVLFILDRRLIKASGSTGLSRIISRLFISASTGEQLSDRTVSTEGFRRLCEKIGHYKVDAFFNQWVLGAGCPRFQINQKFNKKRLHVEMTISQKQDTLPTVRKLEKNAFLREFKEETNGVYAGDLQPFFTGPMTIRIHEADGTPYEHIVEIREGVQRIEIPYHTKYKRLKRSRRERERHVITGAMDITADNDNDVLLYSLGDVLQSPEDIKEWGLVDWDEEMQSKMDQESYEWIRMDADFEWICSLTTNMPPYMYVSQLQQDRDVVAQQESMLYLKSVQSHPLVSTILVRTLLDRRYFHGIRTMAADILPNHATEQHGYIGRRHLEKAFQHFFCHGDSSSMPKSNDFADKKSYLIQCAIPRAMARVRNTNDKCPQEARQFILDQLSFNDNHSNEYSDHFYIANLITALTESLLPMKIAQPGDMSFSFDEEDVEELKKFQNTAIDEMDRYRRMDEWDPSYQNIYTVTALDCKRRLMKAGVIPEQPRDFLIYGHNDTLDVVKIQAMKGLVDTGAFQSGAFLRFFLVMMSTDASPFVRQNLFHLFVYGLAGIAFGEHIQEEPTPVHDELLVEEDASMDAKKAHIVRTTSIEGALTAMRQEMMDNNDLQKGLRAAIGSRNIGLSEQNDLLDVCLVLYDFVEALIVRLKLPRYWKCESKGKGRLLFKQTEKVRMKVAVKRVAPVLHVVPPSKSVTLSIPPISVSMKPPPPKRPSPPDKPPSMSSTAPTSRIVKLSIRREKLLHYPQGQFGKLPSTPTASIIPPRPSPSPSTTSAVGRTSDGTNSVPKVRIPLPTGPRIPLPDGLTVRVPLPEAAPVPVPLERKPSLKLKLIQGALKRT